MMKRSMLSGSARSSETDMDEQIQETVVDAITESDKTVEIKPANKSSGRRVLPLLVLIGGAFVAGYWLGKSQKPTQKLQSVASETADRTKQMTEQAADTIQEGGETMADRVEEESQKAGEQVQQTAESAAEKTEQAGEKAAEKTEQAGEKAAEKADGSGSAGSSSSS